MRIIIKNHDISSCHACRRANQDWYIVSYRVGWGTRYFIIINGSCGIRHSAWQRVDIWFLLHNICCLKWRKLSRSLVCLAISVPLPNVVFVLTCNISSPFYLCYPEWCASYCAIACKPLCSHCIASILSIIACVVITSRFFMMHIFSGALL